MTNRHSMVLIAPVADKDALIAVADLAFRRKLGLSVQLSSDGSEPATHAGAHGWVGDAFRAALTALMTETPPPEIEGVPAAQIEDLRSRLIVSFGGEIVSPGGTRSIGTGLEGRGHFDAVLADQGLAVVQVPLN